ncbi:MAG TPA: nitrilase-related carbon-nitrogen hydrolase [Polyangia bacterium]|jgi:apolipoprotein N-acyltransferase|nr:nitrilase-related carbon-nitrogen hydrolase [Polyangia bacterium]
MIARARFDLADGPRVALGCALAAASAVMLAFAFSPHGAWFFVWIGFAPMLVAQHRVLPARWSALAPAISVGGFVAGCFGGVFPAGAAWYMKALPIVVGVVVFAGSSGARRALSGSWPLQGALGWVAVELARSFIPALGTWGFLGYAMFRQTWFLQPVSIFGTYGLDVLIVLVNYSLSMLLVAWLDRRRSGDDREDALVPLSLAVRWCAAVGVACVLWGAASVAMRPEGEPTVRVAALQPGVRWRELGSTAQARDRALLDVLSEQTRRAGAQGAKLVVWPESALHADPQIAYRAPLSALAREIGAYLFVGYRLQTPSGNRNEVVTIGPDGAFLGRYGKDHPVSFLHETSVTRGTYPTYETAFGVVGAAICADIDFTDTPRKLALGGAKIIAVPSADWPEISTKHYVLAVFRALETGAAVVKSEHSRDSVIVDGAGALVATAITPQGSPAVLVADVASRGGVPLAARWGDWVGWLCGGGLVVLRLGGLARSRRRAPRLFAAKKGLL